MPQFESEDIPNQDNLFYRIHKDYIRNKNIIPGAFRAQGDGMSTDWDRYSSAEQNRLRGRIPTDNMVVSLNVGRVREIELLSVDHTPMDDNRAHTDVSGLPEKGELKTETRARLKQLANTVIDL